MVAKQLRVLAKRSVRREGQTLGRRNCRLREGVEGQMTHAGSRNILHRPKPLEPSGEAGRTQTVWAGLDCWDGTMSSVFTSDILACHGGSDLRTRPERY
eukprot:355476-Chlamydomonas_euryale.AAC.3